jgi:hypothetical protein
MLENRCCKNCQDFDAALLGEDNRYRLEVMLMGVKGARVTEQLKTTAHGADVVGTSVMPYPSALGADDDA